MTVVIGFVQRSGAGKVVESHLQFLLPSEHYLYLSLWCFYIHVGCKNLFVDARNDLPQGIIVIVIFQPSQAVNLITDLAGGGLVKKTTM